MNNYGYYYNRKYPTNSNNERLAGGFVFPFLLGGVTGAALAPNFWNNNQGYYYPPQPYYVPIYYTRRWF